MSVCSKILLFFIIFWSWVLSKIIQKKFIYKHQFCVFCSTLCLSSWLLYPTTTMRLLREEVVVTNISICLLTPNTCTHKKNFFFWKNFSHRIVYFFCYYHDDVMKQKYHFIMVDFITSSIDYLSPHPHPL